MMANCSGSCGTCGENCADRKEPMSLMLESNEVSNVKKVIGVVSGKGGVGKSLVTSMLSVLMNRRGYKTAVLDADVTGPSIPKAFGIKSKATASADGKYILPAVTKTGIKVMSVNLILEDDTDPVIFRGPVIAGTVKQFWTDVEWDDVDYMFVDMPPGTGDVPLTVFQSLPLDGIVIMTSPQELVGMVVAKAVKMAEMMNIPIIGLVENMSYVECPDCSKHISVFGESHIDDIAKQHNLQVLAKLPIDPEFAKACDGGMIELSRAEVLDNVAAAIENFGMVNKIAVTYDNGEVFQHFGHTETFKVYNIERGSVVSSEVIGTEGAGHESLAGFLKEKGVNLLICGNLGDGAKKALGASGVQIIAGAQGSADDAVNAYLAGELKHNADAHCDHHDHEDGEHSCGEGGCGHNCGH
ncbi:MAG: P-loop NTPase [Clostridia bacterium]|nr:P-loop NTPase [Clostridia bacterium]